MGDTTMRELVYGKGAHVDPMACVEDITSATATRTVAGYPHSIWQIVEHMNYWMDYEFRQIAGDRPVLSRSRDRELARRIRRPRARPQWQETGSRFSDLLDETGHTCRLRCDRARTCRRRYRTKRMRCAIPPCERAATANYRSQQLPRRPDRPVAATVR